MTTLIDILNDQAQERPQKAAFSFQGTTLTFSEVRERAWKVAARLRADGVQSGDRIVYLARNRSEYFEIAFGALKLGAILTPLSFRLAAPETKAILDDAEAKLIFVEKEFRALAPEGSLPTITFEENYETWRDDVVDDIVDCTISPEDVAVHFYTSGTTGAPKAVMLTHDNLLSSIKNHVEPCSVSEYAVNLTAAPLFHAAGVIWSLVSFSCGATTHILPDAQPDVLISTIEKFGVSHCFLAPAMIKFLLDAPDIRRTDLTSLNTVLYGASPISHHTLQRAIDVFQCRFVQGYGLTETSGAVAMLRWEDHHVNGPYAHRLNAAGSTLDGVELKIVDSASDKETPIGEVGEIRINAPAQFMAGYWRRPEATTAAVDENGWFKSGDAGYLDEDGYLYVVERIKDMIISGGENIYPAEVENVLMAHASVADCAVIGVPHEKYGETPLALVVCKEGDNLDINALLAHAEANLARYKVPKRIEERNEIPRNPAGKVLKRDLRAPYWENHKSG